MPSPAIEGSLARMFHELLAAAKDMAVLPGVLGCRPLQRTVQVRLETNTLRLPGGTTIFMVSREQFMKHPGCTLDGEVYGSLRPADVRGKTCLTKSVV